MTSLASSPIVPLATAVLAGALIVGTSYGGNSEDAIAAEDASDAAAAEVAAAANDKIESDAQAAAAAAGDTAAPAGEVGANTAAAPATATVTCAANSCTVVFPISGGTATVFKKPFILNKGYANRGGSFTLGGKKLAASTKKAGAAGPFSVTISKADATSITAVVTKK